MRFELLDGEDGLSNHWIYKVEMDSSGFMWIGTSEGLNRYDGHTFKLFRHNDSDSSSLLHDYKIHPLVDKAGALWVGYADGGLSKYDPHCQCFKHFPEVFRYNSLGRKSNTHLLHAEGASVWFSGVGTGLNIYDTTTGKTIHYDLPDIIKGYYGRGDENNYNSVLYVYQSSDNQYWLCTANGLYTFDPKTGRFSYKIYTGLDFRKSRNDYFNKLIPEGEKGFWLSTWGGGICYFDRTTERFTSYKFDKVDLMSSIGNVIYDVTRKSEDELWIATGDKGIGIFNTKNHSFRFYIDQLPSGEAQNYTNATQIWTTPDGVLFFANNNGLFKYNPFAKLFHFRTLPIAHSQNNDAFHISDIVEDPGNHAIYFATYLGDGFNVLDTRTGKLTPHPVEIGPSHQNQYMFVLDILMDKNGRVWVASRDYCYEYDKVRKRLVKISKNELSKLYKEEALFGNFAEDPDGDIWVLTANGGLHQFYPVTRSFSPKLNDVRVRPNAIEGIRAMTIDKNGKIWVEKDGRIAFFNKHTAQFEWPVPIETLDSLKISTVAIAADKFGDLWIANSRKGLVRINTQNPSKITVQTIGPAQGLPSVLISNMGADPEGHLWMSTLSGVVYYNVETNAFRVFNHSVGMDKNTAYMRFLGDRSGTFYITTPGRYCKVNLQDLNRKLPLPKVYIDQFRIFNKEQIVQISENRTLTLRPGEDFFSFDLGCIDFTNQAQNKFAYMLEGWNTDWVQNGTRRYASFTNLDGGDYVFKVKVANSEGGWGEPIAVPLFIKTPIYQKSWFAILAALIFAGVIYALYLYRVKQIEQTERLKTEFNRQLAETKLAALRAQMNPHFIFNCLNSINRYIIKSDIKTSSYYLTKFAKLIRLILDNSEHKSVVLSIELEALRLYIEMEALRFDHKFTFEISLAEDVEADNIEVPPLIIQPYVENAIWHGLLHKESGGRLSIKVTQKEETLICEVTDNGIGRKKAMEYRSQNDPNRKSVGMKLTEQRLRMLAGNFSEEGSVKIIDLYDEESNPAGTSVIITIPI